MIFDTTKRNRGGQGFQDCVFDTGTVSGAIQNNKLINYSSTADYTIASFALKQPLTVVRDDVIKLQIQNMTGTAKYCDCYYYAYPQTGRLTFKTNFDGPSFRNGIVYTVAYDSINIIAFAFGRRLNSFSNVSGDVHVYVNDELII